MRILLVWAIMASCAWAQTRLYLRTRVIDTAGAPGVLALPARTLEGAGKQRWLVQFEGDAPLDALAERGAQVLGAVPENGYVLSAPDGFDWSDWKLTYRSSLEPGDKWSPALQGGPAAFAALAEEPSPGHFLVMFHEDVAPSDARRIIAQTDLDLREHPNLAGHHVLVTGTLEQAKSLTDWDEVAFILPASDDLVQGVPVAFCAGAHLNHVPMSPLAGDIEVSHWRTAGNAETQIGTAFGALSRRLGGAAARAEIERALREWARVVKLRFTESTATAARTFHFLFATGDHGDPFPFTGASGVIAHAFFPAPPNPEPIAGDVHFNDDMTFRIGADIDLFSVALHEIGHSLGLQHTDSSGAVMYPYYRMNSGLSAIDIANIRRLYASTEAALLLSVHPPPARTEAASVIISGTVTGASGRPTVTWRVANGNTGTAAVDAAGGWQATLALNTGSNTITITARDSAGGLADRQVTITRGAAAPPGPAPPSPATVRISEPASALRTGSRSVRLAGSSSNVRRITWTNQRGGSGDVTPSSNGAWTVAVVPLQPGENPIIVTGDGGPSARVTVIQETATTDRTPPLLSITTPAASTATTQAQITVRGSAADASGVTEVTWSNSAGGSGIAHGTQSWIAEVKLVPGFNTITVRARDSAGNSASRVVTINRR